MSLLDRVRSRAYALVDRAPGRVRELAHKANDALGRPLADAGELEDRRSFTAKTSASTSTSTSTSTTPKAKEQAPVIVYYMEKQKRDVGKLTDILESNGVKFTVTNIQEDPAAQYAVKRDAHGKRLPVVFVAGDCLGGREDLVNAASSGELKKKVFGA